MKTVAAGHELVKFSKLTVRKPRSIQSAVTPWARTVKIRIRENGRGGGTVTVKKSA